MTRGGVIVAGGRSTRFDGGDKAVAPLRGTPLVRHVADRLAPTVDTIVVNCRDDQQASIEDAMAGLDTPTAIAIDPVDDQGPVSGLATGLEALPATVESAAVVACDMPLLEASFVNHLFDVAAASGADAVVPRDEDGWYQVLHAVYEPTHMVSAARRALEADAAKLLAPLEYLDPIVLDPEDYADHGSSRSFENVNTRSALEAVQRTLDPDSATDYSSS